MWINIPKELERKIEIIAKNHGIAASDLVGCLVESDFDELADLAEAITRLRTPGKPVSLAEMRRKLASNGVED